ncbi:MAG: 16S rRNA processing protein RimM [Alphaproteobacteria bacterium]|nr:16S rRNA processing protein RimM [Alphaproteobacteria bacterium]
MKRICLGKIVAAHGVKGLVKIAPFGDDVSLLDGELYTGETGEDSIKITLLNPLGKYILAKVDGITTREAAENCKHALYVPRNTLPETDEDEYYIEDLIGMTAIENDQTAGKIIDVPDYGAGPLLDIKAPNGKTYLLPFTNDYVGTVDLEKKTVIVMNTATFNVD